MPRDLFDDAEFGKDAVRQAWKMLTEIQLPNAAIKGNWSVRYSHCFARILLDVIIGRPWRDCITPPAWRNAPDAVLAEAIELGQALLNGSANIDGLNRRSLALRGKI
jgi:hypothetical protein